MKTAVRKHLNLLPTFVIFFLIIVVKHDANLAVINLSAV